MPLIHMTNSCTLNFHLTSWSSYDCPEAIAWGYSVENGVLKNSQNSQENTSAGVSF